MSWGARHRVERLDRQKPIGPSYLLPLAEGQRDKGGVEPRAVDRGIGTLDPEISYLRHTLCARERAAYTYILAVGLIPHGDNRRLVSDVRAKTKGTGALPPPLQPQPESTVCAAMR